ncbi:MAG: 2,3-bisphosphoglycerate-independent phosphoglycerate mutase [Parcubacteria group bacterium GW2011_GWA2_43_17]|nr:MAG: 2,3-bisphosphoglycerate-independent phosphoglycerate mutase [Parcubacteria group bacterium GW2011_GWA2_43_17]KKT97384.1 MAG: 2,3-bisphosphoglycerate-independent phosphoglycerate mutase [Parcubacteria group bacterium GW2011_GWC2_45_15]
MIMDGWGVKEPSKANAISLAKKNNFDQWLNTYPAMVLQAAGEAVGLSWGEMGNSEVGHLSLGSGRIIYQSLPRITRAISDSSFFKNQAFLKALTQVKSKQGNLHIMGLLSSGGIHSYNEHLYALIELAKNQGVDNVFIHVFLDGRDTSFDSGKKFVAELQKKLKRIGAGQIATLSGRFYAMDRDNNWDRVEKTYRAMVDGQAAQTFADPLEAISSSYNNKIYDEEMVPVVIAINNQPAATVKDGDALIFFNFRADRAREISKAFILPGFEKFHRDYIKDLVFVAMTEYERNLPMEIAFPPEAINTPLAKIISQAGLKQLHIAETEKYAHVTFFFNGGLEQQFEGEERVIIPSPRIPSYDAQPEMSATAVAERVIKEINSDKFDFIVINFANPDMVAHTGNLKATVKAVEILDNLAGQIVNTVLAQKGVVLITADHGNAEELYDLQTGIIVKEHSKNGVPLYIIGEEFRGKITKGAAGKDLHQMTASGILADVAPTILKIMGLQRPEDMTGRSLI